MTRHTIGTDTPSVLSTDRLHPPAAPRRGRGRLGRWLLVSPLLVLAIACEDDGTPPAQTALPGNAPAESEGTTGTAGAEPVEPTSPQETPAPNPDAGAPSDP